MEQLININEKNFVKTVENNNNVIILFWSIEDDNTNKMIDYLNNQELDNFKYIFINIYENTIIAQNFVIKSIPAIIDFTNWEPIKHIIWTESIVEYINIK